MSEFYALRRNAITDMSALFGFLIGFLGSAPFAWPFLQVGFQTDTIVKGFAYFISITMGAGVLCGIAGLAVGRGLGWFWERGHRVLRRARGHELVDERPAKAAAPARHPEALPAPTGEVADDHGIRYESAILEPGAFRQLMERATGEAIDPDQLGPSLRRTINIGAWDGDRLVGALRLLTDGFRHTVVTDIAVDPSYRRRGIGRALMRHATDRSSGTLSVARVPPGTEGFFRRLDALPAYEGFVHGGKARLH